MAGHAYGLSRHRRNTQQPTEALCWLWPGEFVSTSQYSLAARTVTAECSWLPGCGPVRALRLFPSMSSDGGGPGCRLRS